MIKLIQTNEIMPLMNKYMFSGENMKKGYKYQPPVLAPAPTTEPKQVPAPAPAEVKEPKQIKKRDANKLFTPFQKDKLFWCFYIILKGYEEYELNHSNSFKVEKDFKIETVEKLKSVKEKLKEYKLKRTELEDELVNKPTISLKGLYALCLVHNVSITYIYGYKYCDLISSSTTDKKGIIMQNEKKENSIKWIMAESAGAGADAGAGAGADASADDANSIDEFLSKIRGEYWLIENIQKPLNAPSAYSLQELLDICKKLHIETHIKSESSEKLKAKTKKQLYEEILGQL